MVPLPFRSAFTLIELLVVIAIIAILAVVVVLTLNPAQLLAQSRDANRVSDMATLNSAINLYSTDQSGASSYSLGSTSTAYLSLPASTTNCTALGMATSGYRYACANTTNYRNASSSGWLPIAFNQISSGAPFGSLPVDPVNQSSSNLYYSYETNGSQYVLSSFMESQKYAKNMQTTGGIDPALYEIGSGVSTLPNASRGLVGYWPLNEGTGNTAIDWSAEGNNGMWYGTATGTSGYYSPGKVFQWAGMFDGSSTYMNVPAPASMNGVSAISIAAWVNISSITSRSVYYDIAQGSGGVGDGWAFGIMGSYSSCGSGKNGYIYLLTNGTVLCSTFGIPANAWEFLVFTFDGTTQNLYINGASAGSLVAGVNESSTEPINIGRRGDALWYFPGEMADVRIYGRGLSAAEVQEIYNAEK